jgi:hypothetical protein
MSTTDAAPAPADDDPITPEVMPDQPDAPADVERWDSAARAIEAAAEVALTDPGMAGRDEFLNLCVQARMLSLSDLAPDGVRGKPYNALLILMTARELGIGPAGALRTVYVVDGRPTLAPKLLNALLRRKGLGYIVPHPDNGPESAGAVPYGPDGQQLGPPSIFSWQDAQLAGLAGNTCTPFEHDIKKVTRTSRDGRSWTVDTCGCKDNYRNYPARMLWQRARGYCVDDYFPEVGLGLYSPDELGAVTDEEGLPLDPGTVALPAGWTDPQAERAEHEAAANAPAPADELWDVWVRLNALPEGLRAEVRERWVATTALTRDGNPIPVRLLNPRQLRTAKSMVNGFEAKARASGVDLDAQRAWLLEEVAESVTALVRGAQGPAPTATDTAPEPPHGPDSPAEGVEGTDTPDDPPADTQAPDPETPEDPAPEDWGERLTAMSQAVRDRAASIDPADVARIADEVKGLHHSKLNKALTDDHGVDPEMLAGSPIDYRRMLLTWNRLDAIAPPPNPVLEDRGEEPF